MKNLFLLISCMLIVSELQSQNLPFKGDITILHNNILEKEQARVIARNLFSERLANQYPLKSSYEVAPVDVTTLEINGLPALYVFSNKGAGFIIISADKAYTPVIGYSLDGVFPKKGISQNFDSFIATILAKLEWLRRFPLPENPEIQAQWEKYLANESDFIPTSTKGVEPLLTCQWNQNYPYNAFCPTDTTVTEGHVPACCAAAAMSMIMYYYRYPLQGSGKHSYNASGYGTQYVDFDATRYNWDSMLDQINDSSGESIPAVAQLLYHAGVSISTIYGPHGSYIMHGNVSVPLMEHFGYSSCIKYVGRNPNTFSESEWENIVIGQLDSLYPVYYFGYIKNSVGHAFVCDGYQVTDSERMFHLNFGWSGTGNGYYTLSNPKGFTDAQGLIKNFFPGKDYPYGCSSHIIRGISGSFEDGSSPLYDYEPGLNCSWLIDPADSVNKICLSFTSFKVDKSDSVFIYDGENETADLMYVYTGTKIPPAVISSGNKIFLKFRTDGNNEYEGWTAEYHSIYPDYCHGTNTLTANEGTFSDGSGNKNYNNNTTCKWKIQPTDAGIVHLIFNSFELEEHDRLNIYSKGDSMVLLGSFTGNQIPEPVISTTGAFLVELKTNGFNTASGFESNYFTSPLFTYDRSISQGVTLYPNPAKEFTILQLVNGKPINVMLAISDIYGRQLYTERISDTKSTLKKNINLGNFIPGIYLLNVDTNKGTTTRKLIVE